MGSTERWTYEISCPECKRTGSAEVTELDGWAFMRARGSGTRYRWVEVSEGFKLIRPPHPNERMRELIEKYPDMDNRNDDISNVFCISCNAGALAK